jgi:hypothetical protein
MGPGTGGIRYHRIFQPVKVLQNHSDKLRLINVWAPGVAPARLNFPI